MAYFRLADWQFETVSPSWSVDSSLSSKCWVLRGGGGITNANKWWEECQSEQSANITPRLMKSSSEASCSPDDTVLVFYLKMIRLLNSMKYKLDVWILPKCILHFIWSNYISVKCKWCFTPNLCWERERERDSWSVLTTACHGRIIAHILFLFRHLSPQERQITSLWTATTYSILSSGSPGPVVLFSRHRETVWTPQWRSLHKSSLNRSWNTARLKTSQSPS